MEKQEDLMRGLAWKAEWEETPAVFHHSQERRQWGVIPQVPLYQNSVFRLADSWHAQILHFKDPSLLS